MNLKFAGRFASEIIFLFLVTLTFLACDGKPASEEETEAPTTQEATVDSTPSQDITQIDGDWLLFWNQFRDAVSKNGRALVTGMTHLPLHGAESLSVQGAKGSLPADEFRRMYGRIIDDYASNVITGMKATEVPYYKIEDQPAPGTTEEELGLSVGSKVYKIATQGGTTLYFSKINGKYKLAWVELD